MFWAIGMLSLTFDEQKRVKTMKKTMKNQYFSYNAFNIHRRNRYSGLHTHCVSCFIHLKKNIENAMAKVSCDN